MNDNEIEKAADAIKATHPLSDLPVPESVEGGSFDQRLIQLEERLRNLEKSVADIRARFSNEV